MYLSVSPVPITAKPFARFTGAWGWPAASIFLVLARCAKNPFDGAVVDGAMVEDVVVKDVVVKDAVVKDAVVT